MIRTYRSRRHRSFRPNRQIARTDGTLSVPGFFCYTCEGTTEHWEGCPSHPGYVAPDRPATLCGRCGGPSSLAGCLDEKCYSEGLSAGRYRWDRESKETETGVKQ